MGYGGFCLNVIEAVAKRRSIRKYQVKPVEDEKLRMVLEAGRLGPSAANRQPCSVVVVSKLEVRRSLLAAYPPEWFASAPVILVVCADPLEAWRRRDGEEFWKVDAAICMQNMVLVSSELGLGTCWIGAFDEKAVMNALSIPAEMRVVAMTPLGYPAEEKDPAVDRKPFEKMVHYDKW
jgi:nitroreductase